MRSPTAVRWWRTRYDNCNSWSGGHQCLPVLCIARDAVEAPEKGDIFVPRHLWPCLHFHAPSFGSAVIKQLDCKHRHRLRWIDGRKHMVTHIVTRLMQATFCPPAAWVHSRH